MKRTIFFAAALSIAAFSFSCKKSESSNTGPATPIANDLVQNYSFKQGTYWVFQKEGTSDKDSVAITKIVTGSNTYPHAAGGAAYTYISMRLNHSNAGMQVAYYTSITLQGGEIMGEIGDIPFYPYYADYLCNNQLDQGYTSSDSRNYNISRAAHLDSFLVTGHYFHDVNKMSYRSSGNLDQFMYWAPGVGVIRVETFDPNGNSANNKSYNLVKWNIIK